MFKKDNDPWVRTFTVSDPVRHKKGYTLYKVTSKVFPKNSIEAVTQVTVWKRYNDFKNLHKALSSLHQGLYLKGTFPPFAKAQIFGRFDDAVIEERRRCALELLEFTAKHPPLFTSQVFVKFFEGGQVVDLQSEPEEKCPTETLQPIVVSITNASGDKPSDSDPKENEEIDVTLGGIWKHRQIADEISISSHTTDDDDRTTFTDEDPSKSTVSDLSEFDPLTDPNALKSQDYCKDWLLSAFESIGVSKIEQGDSEELVFPKPFSDVGDIEVPCPNISTSASEAVTSELDSNSESVDECLAPPPSRDVWSFSYMDDIKKLLLSAEHAETVSDYSEAFTLYKKIIDILLSNAKEEQCSESRQKIQKLASQYLKRAELIYSTQLSELSRKHRVLNPEKAITIEENHIRRSMKDLAKYRVIGILSKVLLVLDVLTNITCVVKVLRKSPEPQNPDLPNIAPRSIDFIVQLYEVYETTDAIFLVLEYASGGRLWDYISSYLQRSPLTPTNGSTLTKGDKTNLNNVYSGKKLETKKMAKENSDDSIPFIDSSLSADQFSAEIFPSSYAALFRNYAANVPIDNVSLAKCKTKQLSFSDDDKTVNNPSNNFFESELLKKNCDTTAFYSENKREIENQNEPKVINWLSSLDNQNKGDNVFPSSSMDLHTFLNGTVGKKFMDRKDATVDENKSLMFSSGRQCVKDHSHKRLGFTEVFHQMDMELSLASSKPTYLPESCIVFWVAEIISALESLHRLGIIWKDLRPENILLGTEGHILLSYQSQWNSVDNVISEKAVQNFYAAPEVSNVFTITSSCDWWSLGAILFELVTGRRLVSCYPSGITSHTNINVPEGVSSMAKDLIQKLLKANPSERLGSGVEGIEDIKCHPFFQSINWDSLKNY